MSRVSFLLVLAAVLVAIAAACGPRSEMSQGPQPPTSLAGTAWRVLSIDGVSPVSGREPTITFDDDRITGSTGCNQYFGGYTYADGTVSLSNVGMTLMACEEEIGTVESAYLKVLNGAATASIDSSGRLLISGTGGDARFDPAG